MEISSLLSSSRLLAGRVPLLQLIMLKPNASRADVFPGSIVYDREDLRCKQAFLPSLSTCESDIH